MNRNNNNRNSSLAQVAYDDLLRRIVEFDLKPFQRLSEASVAEMIGLGRTPVREALVRLAALGFVDVLPQRGSYVAPLRVQDLEQSQFIRESLEIALLRRAMSVGDHKDLARLLKNEVTLQHAYLEIGDKQSFLESDEKFHRLIAERAGLGGVTQEIARNRAHMDRFRNINVDWGEDLEEVREQHAQIADAIERGAGDEAQEHMLLHLQRVYVFIDNIHEQFPDYFEDAPEAQIKTGNSNSGLAANRWGQE